MQPLEILQALYPSENNCRIESFWDGGWTAVLGAVVRRAADGDRELVNMNWGFVLSGETTLADLLCPSRAKRHGASPTR